MPPAPLHIPAVPTSQGLNNLQAVGQDIAIRGNPQLTSLAGLASLRSIGTYRGSDIFIEDNPKLADLGGLDAATIYGTVTVQNNSPSLPAASADALKSKAQAVPITIETLTKGLPANVSKPAVAAGK